MNLLFFQAFDCPFCLLWKRVLVKANSILPIGSSVSKINVNRDNRTKYLKNTTDYEYPAILVIKDKAKRFYASTRVVPEVTRSIVGSSDELTNDVFLHALLRGEKDA